MEKGKKNRLTSLYTTIGVHALMLLLFFLVLAWSAPDPPIPEYGIELSLGGLTEEESASRISEVTEEEIEPLEEPAESPAEETEVVEEVSEEETETVDEEQVEEAVTQDTNSPDVVEQVVAEKKIERKEVVESKATEAKEENEVKPVNAEPILDNRALYKKNDGDGKPASEGASLDMSGWIWDSKPNPNDQSSENGKIVFQIIVDDVGDIINVRTLEKTVSPVVEKIYRDAVMELTFSPTAGSRSSASQSTGKITFIIQSK